MLLYSYLSLLAGFFYLLLGILVLMLDKKSRLHRLFAFFSFLFSYWAIIYVFRYSTDNPAQVELLYRLSSPVWAVTPAVLFHFFSLQTGNRLSAGRSWLFVLLYLPALFIIIDTSFWGGLYFSFENHDGALYPRVAGTFQVVFFMVYYGLYLLSALVMIAAWGLKSRYQAEKRAAILVFTSGLLTLVVNIMTNLILPATGVRFVPDIAQIGMLIWFFGVALSIFRYRLLVVTPGIAVNQILTRIMDMVAVLDRNGHVVKMNEQMENLLRVRGEDWKDKDFGSMLRESDVFRQERERLSGGGQAECLVRMSLLDTDGNELPAIISISLVTDRYGDPLGYVVVARDLRLSEKIRDELLEKSRSAEKERAYTLSLEQQAAEKAQALLEANERLRREIDERDQMRDMWKKYAFIVNTSREFMSLINRDYIYEAVNDAYCRAHNRSRESIVGARVEDIWGKDIFTNLIRKYMERSFAGEEVSYRQSFRFGGLGVRLYEVCYYPYFNFAGKVTHIAVVSRDVTSRDSMDMDPDSLRA